MEQNERDRARDPKIWMIEWRPQGVGDFKTLTMTFLFLGRR